MSRDGETPVTTDYKTRNPSSRAIIHLDRLEHNVQVLQHLIGEEVPVMAVIKANAYGHGAVEVARRLNDKVYGFAVAQADEGIELRQSGIEKPILVFGVPHSQTVELYPEFDLTATVSHPDHFDLLVAGTDYHLNFDTGMGRYGFLPDQVEEVQRLMDDHSELQCTGLYSHFATAEDPQSEQASLQFIRFNHVCNRFPDDIMVHMANTGGAVFYANARFDAVRLGIGLYGYAPGNTAVDGLKPVMEWHSRLAQVRPIREGMTVSYGARWTAPSDGWLGVIPVGYADGIPRALTGQLEVMVGNRRCLVVGTITMDSIMVWLGKENPPKAGTDVVVMGNEGNTAAEWAQKLNTIPYEVLCGLSRRVSLEYKS